MSKEKSRNTGIFEDSFALAVVYSINITGINTRINGLFQATEQRNTA